MRFWRKKVNPNAYIVWGIRAPAAVRTRWTNLSGILGIPCNRLILYNLKDWSIANREIILDKEGRKKLAEAVSDTYLKGVLDS